MSLNCEDKSMPFQLCFSFYRHTRYQDDIIAVYVSHMSLSHGVHMSYHMRLTWGVHIVSHVSHMEREEASSIHSFQVSFTCQSILNAVTKLWFNSSTVPGLSLGSRRNDSARKSRPSCERFCGSDGIVGCVAILKMAAMASNSDHGGLVVSISTTVQPILLEERNIKQVWIWVTCMCDQSRIFPEVRKHAISKVALLKYNAKSIHHDAEQWPEQMVDISPTHRVPKSGLFEVASRHASTHSYF